MSALLSRGVFFFPFHVGRYICQKICSTKQCTVSHHYLKCSYCTAMKSVESHKIENIKGQKA